MTKLGQFRYTGNGKLLEQNEEYVMFETEEGVEAYGEGDSEPVTVNRGAFTSLRNGNLERVEGATPMA